MDIGQKIKMFRKRSRMSQMDLEISINAASGSISRIENNQVNPNKETIFNIANSLSLTTSETSFLFGIESINRIVPDSFLNNHSDILSIIFKNLDNIAFVETSYSEGRNIFIERCSDTLQKSSEDVIFLGNSQIFRKYYPIEIDIKNYIEPRIRLQKQAKVFFSEDGWTEDLKSNPHRLFESKPLKGIKSDCMININDFSVVFMGLSNKPTILEIFDSNIARQAKLRFNNLWSKQSFT